MVRGDAVLEAVGTAGVLRHVAAQRGCLLAGGVGQVLIAQRGQGIAEFQVEHARLDARPEIGDVHLENPVHPDHLDHDAALDGNGAAGEIRAPTARNKGNTELVADLDHPRDLLGGGHEDNRVRAPLLQIRIVLVELEVHRGRPHIGLSDDLPERLDQHLFRHDVPPTRSRRDPTPGLLYGQADNPVKSCTHLCALPRKIPPDAEAKKRPGTRRVAECPDRVRS